MKKIAIIGAGASGYMAAITAAERYGRDAEIVIFEKNNSVLNKVRISGGGRCNVTHDQSDRREFARQYPRGEQFMKKILPVFGQQDTIDWFARRGVRLKTESDGRMFPTTDDSATIIHCLSDAAARLGVRVHTSMGMRAFTLEKKGFSLLLQGGQTYETDVLLLATGGHPQLSGYSAISSIGIGVETPLPSLFTFNAPGCPLRNLPGISVPMAETSISGTKLKTKGPVLLTHWGFSGPAILRLSAWGARILAEKNYHFDLRINWLPDMTLQALLDFLYTQKTEQPKRQIGSHPLFGFSTRLWSAFLEQTGIEEAKKWSDMAHKDLNRLADNLQNAHYLIAGKSTFKEEFVTAGGVKLEEINPQTMEHRRIRAYFSLEKSLTSMALPVDSISKRLGLLAILRENMVCSPAKFYLNSPYLKADWSLNI